MSDIIRVPIVQSSDGIIPDAGAVEYVTKSITEANGIIRVPIMPTGWGEVIRVGIQPAPVVAAFSHVADDLAVDFFDASTGAISEWAWDFGDGSTSTERHPAHNYTNAGTYTVTLAVTGTHGPTDSVSHDLTVAASVAPSTWQELTDDTYWTPEGDHPWPWDGSYWSGGYAWCMYASASESAPAVLLPTGGWETGWRPEKIVIYGCQFMYYPVRFRLLDAAGNLLASGGLGGAGYSINFQGQDIDRLEWWQHDANSIYGCITGIHFYGPPLAEGG